MLSHSKRNLKERREAGEAVPQALARTLTGVERSPLVLKIFSHED
jgi:hypothetical protein